MHYALWSSLCMNTALASLLTRAAFTHHADPSGVYHGLLTEYPGVEDECETAPRALVSRLGEDQLLFHQLLLVSLKVQHHLMARPWKHKVTYFSNIYNVILFHMVI